jgi:radical SAM enzyme (TIGR01210 family)
MTPLRAGEHMVGAGAPIDEDVRANYPETSAERDAFVLAHRPSRPVHDPWAHQGVHIEDERAADGAVVDVATLLLTGRECPWRCAMCDLWQHTTPSDTPVGALPRQVRDAVTDLRRAARPLPPHVKLYNAGSFFDSRAVPPSDYAAIAAELTPFRHVIVESHPSLAGRRVGEWRLALDRATQPGGPPPSLEIAMGLETTHADALERLNKRMSIDLFARTARRLTREGISVRAFVLVHPPFVPAAEQDRWQRHAVDFAFECGASVVSLIPTRSGNGTLDLLAHAGAFTEPGLDDLEHAIELALPHASGRVFADLWDLQRFARCQRCLPARRARLHRVNLTQRVTPRVECAWCGRPS